MKEPLGFVFEKRIPIYPTRLMVYDLCFLISFPMKWSLLGYPVRSHEDFTASKWYMMATKEDRGKSP